MVTQGDSVGRRERDKLGLWVYHIHTTVYKTGKQQGPTV